MSMFRLRILTARSIMIVGALLAETICPELKAPEDRRNNR